MHRACTHLYTVVVGVVTFSFRMRHLNLLYCHGEEVLLEFCYWHNFPHYSLFLCFQIPWTFPTESPSLSPASQMAASPWWFSCTSSPDMESHCSIHPCPKHQKINITRTLHPKTMAVLQSRTLICKRSSMLNVVCQCFERAPWTWPDI